MAKSRKKSRITPEAINPEAPLGLTKEGKPRQRRPGAGRPEHAPTPQTRKTVETLSGWIKQEKICALIGLKDHKTLSKHYGEEIERGMAKTDALIAESLMAQAVGFPAQYDDRGKLIRAEQPRVPAVTIFLGKVKLGLRERDPVPAPETPGNYDLTKLTDKELALYEKLLSKAIEPAQPQQSVVNAHHDRGGQGRAGTTTH